MQSISSLAENDNDLEKPRYPDVRTGEARACLGGRGLTC